MKTNRFGALLVCVTVLLLTLQNSARAASPSGKFGEKWRALVGEWKGENPSGGNSGACGFHLDLADNVIVRTNHAVLAATGGKPAGAHDDLMIVYPGPTADKAKAIYFDNEGHVIDYDAEWSVDGNTLTFLGRPGAGPQFRLIYRKLDAKRFSVSFEMAAPGQGSFKVYTSGTITRASG